MKRNMDLVRDLLLAIEEHPQLDGARLIQVDEEDNLGVTDYPFDQIVYHLVMLIEAGLVEGSGQNCSVGPIISRLTWQGHDFIDSIRDPIIWQKTKEGVQKAGGFSLQLLGDLAKGLIKKKIEDHTGVQL